MVHSYQATEVKLAVDELTRATECLVAWVPVRWQMTGITSENGTEIISHESRQLAFLLQKTAFPVNYLRRYGFMSLVAVATGNEAASTDRVCDAPRPLDSRY